MSIDLIKVPSVHCEPNDCDPMLGTVAPTHTSDIEQHFRNKKHKTNTQMTNIQENNE